MINPPFPYNVIIRRVASPANPFEEVEETNMIVYDGVCDFEGNRHPTIKNGVQTSKYKLYLPDNTTDVRIGDDVELSTYNRVIKGKVADVFPTNFGLTINWDNITN